MNTSDYPAKESGRREPLNEAFTPDMITELGPNDVFVFGSNLAGQHCGGAARTAFQRFGAVWGEGEGLQGQSAALPPFAPTSTASSSLPHSTPTSPSMSPG